MMKNIFLSAVNRKLLLILILALIMIASPFIYKAVFNSEAVRYAREHDEWGKAVEDLNKKAFLDAEEKAKDQANWKIYQDTTYGYSFKYPPTWSSPSRSEGDSDPDFVIYYPRYSTNNAERYFLTLKNPQHIESNTQTNYCTTHHDRYSSRCEQLTLGNEVATIDWGDWFAETALVTIPHPISGQIVFELSPVDDNAKQAFRSIIATFKFTPAQPKDESQETSVPLTDIPKFYPDFSWTKVPAGQSLLQDNAFDYDNSTIEKDRAKWISGFGSLSGQAWRATVKNDVDNKQEQALANYYGKELEDKRGWRDAVDVNGFSVSGVDSDGPYGSTTGYVGLNNGSIRVISFQYLYSENGPPLDFEVFVSDVTPVNALVFK